MNIKSKIKDKVDSKKPTTRDDMSSGSVAALVKITIPSKTPFYQLQFFNNPRVGYTEYYGKAKVEIVELLGRDT